jgi:hypothetical protein
VFHELFLRACRGSRCGCVQAVAWHVGLQEIASNR